ncbi:hypothetical protein M8J76_012994 [Diaphorina citri]|nr:hypothetical protein M8J76_012994 [Diaphorina citri]
MGGVDRFDQKRGTYDTGRKSRKFWMRLFYFHLGAAIVISYILYQTTHRNPKLQIDFRQSLERSLVGNFTRRKRPASDFINVCSKKKCDLNPNKVLGVPDEIKFSNVGIHMPVGLEEYKRCRYCSGKSNNKRSKIECEKCKVPLCIVPCFYMFHKKP